MPMHVVRNPFSNLKEKCWNSKIVVENWNVHPLESHKNWWNIWFKVIIFVIGEVYVDLFQFYIYVIKVIILFIGEVLV